MRILALLKTSRRVTATCVGVTLLTAGLAAAPASAASTALAGKTIEKASGTSDIATGTISDAGNAAIVTTDENGTISIPRTAVSGVRFTAGDTLTDFTLGLPATGAPSATPNGTQVYSGSAAGFSTAVQPVTDGARTLVYIKKKGAPLSYRFPLQLPPGGQLVPSVDAHGNEDGGVDVTVTTQAGDGLYEAIGIIAHIDKPWVRDATGAAFNASYAIEGNTLVLNAADSRRVCGARGCTVVNATYPLVADPSVKRNCGIVTCSFYFSRKVTKNLKDSLGVAGTMTSLAAAQICAKIPHPVGVAACAAAVAVVGIRAGYNINAAGNRHGCFVVRINMAKWLAGGPAVALGFANVRASNRYCYGS